MAFATAAATASAQEPDWVGVATYEGTGADIYMAQIDAASITRSGGQTRFWLRLVNGGKDADPKNPFFRYLPAAFGPSLYEANCAAGQLRLVQGSIIVGYDGPGIPLARPAPWEYVAPGSLAQLVFRYACNQK
jgi:hypothetical protein